MQTIRQDLRFGARSLLKQPCFTLLAALALALGIGSATSIFSVIHAVLLDPFPYTDAEKVVAIQIRDSTSTRPGGRTFFQLAEFLDFQEQSGVFEEVIGGGGEDVLMTTGEGALQFSGGLVTPNTFRFLGVPAQLGRGILPEDAKPGAPPVFVMSHKMWAAQYNLDPSILGRTFTLNGTPSTLVGIMPRRFTKLGADLWRPVGLDGGNTELQSRYFMFQAKLKPGISPEAARAQVEGVARRLATVYPGNYPKTFTVHLPKWVDSLVGQFRTTLYTLAAAVALLLLIACGNVANMLLARATARGKEMAIRSSLGASRARLVRQLLLESFLLALAGMVLGCGLSFAGIQAIVKLIPEGLIPRESVIQLNLPVLLFSLGVAAATSLLFGLAPALQAARRDLVEPLKDAAKGSSGGARGGRLRGALVVAEVALSLVLLTGAGLLMRSFSKLQNVDLGFPADRILSARLPLPRGQYQTAEAKGQFFRPLLARLQSLPGVVAATATSTLPPYGGIGSDIDIPGKTHSETWRAIFQLCSEGWFPTMGLKPVRGRVLTEQEVNGARKVVVVNRTLAEKYLGNDDPIGRMIRIKMLETLPADGRVADAVFEIVGVVEDARNQGVRDPVQPEIFVPYTITGAFERGVLVRAAGDPHSLLNSVRREIWAVDRNVALTLTGSLEDFLTQFTYAEPRFSLVLLGVFAGVGLLLVAIGVYSVVAYAVSRQTHEIGIRVALGAGRGDVMRLVLRSGLAMIGAGMFAGVAASLAVTRVLSTQLWQVSARDPAAFGAAAAVIGLAGLAACYFPARRATRVDPLVALRHE